MLPFDKLTSLKKLVTHANCPDGTASALIIRHVLPDIEVKFVTYGTAEHEQLPAEPNTLFCDFAPPQNRIEEFVKAGTMVLDHHGTAKDLVERFGEHGVFADEKEEPGVSGAVLAYQHVWKPLAYQGAQRPSNHPVEGYRRFEVELFAKVAGVRDTWQKKDDLWVSSCRQAEILRFYPVDMLLGDRQFFDHIPQYEEVGQVLMLRQKNECVAAIRDAYRFMTSKVETRVVVVPTTNTSDVADMIGDEADLVIGFRYACEGETQKIHVSTRSRGTFDCGKFCKRFGGGGHKNAAGCTFMIYDVSSQPYRFLEETLEAYEDTVPF